MDRAVVLQHVPGEGPLRLAPALRARGLAVEVRRLDLGEPVPGPDEAMALLVVMGGPMGVGDLGDPRYPFLRQEAALLRTLIAADRPLLGICLGAQLIAHAAGARVHPNRRADGGRVYEVGWAPLDLLRPADPALAGLGARETVLHWHGDTFTLPDGAELLASTPDCPHQMFRLGRRVLALQFHIEVDAPTVTAWTAEDAAFVALAHGPDGAQRIAAGTARHAARFAEVGSRMIDNLLGCLLDA